MFDPESTWVGKFRLPPTEQELRSLGPNSLKVVTFKINHVDSDTLLITKNSIQVLMLARLFFQDLKKCHKRDR